MTFVFSRKDRIKVKFQVQGHFFVFYLLFAKLCINVYISKKQKTFLGHFTSGLKISIICIERLLSYGPLKMGGSMSFFKKANFKAI